MTAVDVSFDDPNLIAAAGVVPVGALAEQAGLPELVAEHLAIAGAANSAGANPVAKVRPLVAGMVAGAEAIADIDRLRHAGIHLVFEQVRAPSTVGTFLRAFTHEHVQQLNRVPRELLVALCTWVNPLSGADQVVFVNRDSTHHQVHGYQKESAALGRHKGQKKPAPADRVGVHAAGPAGGGRDPAAQRQGGRPCRGRCGGDGGEGGPLGDRVATANVFEDLAEQPWRRRRRQREYDGPERQ